MGRCEHIVMHDYGVAECKHCGATYNHNGMLPAPLDFALKVMELFMEMHQDCESVGTTP